MNLPNGYILQQGKYKLMQVVGQGGFGITYSGVWFTEVKGPLGTLKTEVPVCIKEYFFKDYCFRDQESNAIKVHSETGKLLFEKFKEKLIKEAKILSDVSHPYVVKVLEVFEENNTAYIVMEYISGCSLKYMLEKNGRLPENKILKYTRQIGEALRFVHEKNILHLDIKPSNILINQNDDAKLIDFGVSKRYDIESQETSTTILTLSKGFASIEQYDDEGMRNFSPCPDIYSLGATMYYLATGKIPTESILRAARPLIKPSEINPEISSKTEIAILKAMEIIPDNRFQSAQEMLDSLDIPKEEYSMNSLREILINKDEETILFNKIPLEKPILKVDAKKKKRTILAGLLIVSSLSIISAVVFFAQKNIAQENHTANLDQIENEIENQSQPGTIIEEIAPLENQTKPAVAKRENGIQGINPTSEIKVSPIPEKGKNLMAESSLNENLVKPSLVEIEENYLTLIASGKKKMGTFDYSGAKNDFTKAKALKPEDDELRELLIFCEEKEEEQQIAKRMGLYEEKMSFGFYKIVRKKETGKYGAIDDKGKEKIPCKYIGVGIAENGRVFVREDDLFDIYNSNGELIGEGLTTYY